MAVIRPFEAIRPAKEVLSLSYDNGMSYKYASLKAKSVMLFRLNNGYVKYDFSNK